MMATGISARRSPSHRRIFAARPTGESSRRVEALRPDGVHYVNLIRAGGTPARGAVVGTATTHSKSVRGNMPWNAILDWRRKRKLPEMLRDPRSARGVRSIGQLEK